MVIGLLELFFWVRLGQKRYEGGGKYLNHSGHAKIHQEERPWRVEAISKILNCLGRGLCKPLSWKSSELSPRLCREPKMEVAAGGAGFGASSRDCKNNSLPTGCPSRVPVLRLWPELAHCPLGIQLDGTGRSLMQSRLRLCVTTQMNSMGNWIWSHESALDKLLTPSLTPGGQSFNRVLGIGWRREPPTWWLESK